MSDPLLIQRQRELLRDLTHLTAERATGDTQLEAAFKARNDAAQREYQDAVQKAQARFDADVAAADSERVQSREAASGRYDAEQPVIAKEYAERRSELERRYELEKERADQEYQEARWSVTTMAEAKKREAEGPRQEAEAKISTALLRGQAIRQEAKDLLKMYGQPKLAYTAAKANLRRPANESLIELKKRLTDAEDALTDLRRLRLPRLFRPGTMLLMLVLLWLAIGVPLFALFPDGLGKAQVPWWAAASGAAVLLELVFAGVGFGLSRAHVHHAWDTLAQALVDIDAAGQRARDLAAKHYDAQLARLDAEDKSDRGLRKVDQKYQDLLATIEQRRADGLARADEKYPKLLETLLKRRDHELFMADEKQSRLVALAKQRLRHDTHTAEEKQRRLLVDSQQRLDSEKQLGGDRWKQGIAQAQASFAAILRETRQLFPDWSEAWLPPKATPPVIRFGEVSVPAACGFAGGSAEAGPGWWNQSQSSSISLPALLPFPERCSVLLRTRDAGRAPAVQALQALMTRFLTSLPAGKCRFTIVDPVGLGENFAAFMHLADFDEQLVGSRIWTETRHIEERLADIAAHMENVIQKYLRNQFRSIEEYNLQAGEVAEPFRVLVVANFPTNFSSEAARRLVSIANSGAGCGVFTLVSVDTRQAMPEGFDLADLEQSAAVLAWDGGRFTWKDPDFGPHPLTLDAPPTGTALTRLLNTVGAAAKDAHRVEVSFDFIAPPVEQYWNANTKTGIDIPLGRAGATKRQHLRLGHGTAQHVLIAGKTGSGKSTLLHALITNLALFYSPDEIELYLVDFKKGVEFKTYANYQLPHARVIAIESEREFGLSVLQRLDVELKKRAEAFRARGAHDVAGFRSQESGVRSQESQESGVRSQESGGKGAATPGSCLLTPGQRMPRILLIVDEFQEFFTEDDKIAQEAALLLDRLVRQGRAFGLHVLLGSQTLGGAYTLARSTIDQMAVRIALQCSEADAHLILNKDNSAARLLSRPGEAIYNDQNGLLEGNDIFQVVWLPDAKREECLNRVRGLARQRKLAPQPQLVFEGNAPADIAKNPALGQLLRANAWPPTPRSASAWLGEAIAIKEPTSATFRRQSGSNLLLLGQHDEAALNILASALVSLAAQHPAAADGARFFLLDGTPADDPRAGTLGKLAQLLPHPVRAGGWRETPALLTELAEELERRQKQHDADWPAWYVFLHGLHRFRDLRKADDDFGFARKSDGPANPAQQLADLLKEGASLGIHALVWCDGLNNLNRALERQALREFEQRVLFQMSVADSSTLIDSPAASKLGLHRALFHTEDRPQPEKFRPYGLPAEAWLNAVRQRLAARVSAPLASAGGVKPQALHSPR